MFNFLSPMKSPAKKEAEVPKKRENEAFKNVRVCDVTFLENNNQCTEESLQ
jgi:hypothetical protein